MEAFPGFAKNHGRESLITVRDIKQTVATATRRGAGAVEVGGTGYTYLKLSPSPLARLFDTGAIGSTEMQAADEIEIVFQALSGALMIRPHSMERLGKSPGGPWSDWLIDAVARYQIFANYWSMRARRGDPTLQILIAAIVDGRPLRQIEGDVRIREKTAKYAIINGLRYYAAVAGWATGGQGAAWIRAAEQNYRLRRLS